jgi:hypothetical protein
MASPPDDPLDTLLDRWGNPPPFRPLASELRQRLQAPRSEPDTIFLRPAFAAMFVAACVLLGLFLAEVRVSRLHRDRDAQLLDSYRRLIEPLVNVAPIPSQTAPKEGHT